jgi:hypothetical protein
MIQHTLRTEVLRLLGNAIEPCDVVPDSPDSVVLHLADLNDAGDPLYAVISAEDDGKFLLGWYLHHYDSSDLTEGAEYDSLAEALAAFTAELV